MGLDINSFTNLSNPIDKLVKETGSNLVDTAENAIVGELSAAFQRIGLGNGSNKSILGNLGEQVLAGIAGEIFGAIGREMNLLSKDDIEDYRGVIANGDSRERDNIMRDQISKINGGNSVDNMVFPPDLNDFYVQLDFKKYRRPAPSVPADVETAFSISLPLPRTMEDRHDIGYNSDTRLGFLGAIANQGQNGVEWDLATGLAYAGKEGIRQLTGDGSDIIGLISQSFGATLNPHLSVMFNQPTLRRHKMQWMLAPNNAKESELIRKITKRIRGASLPSFARDQQGNANINILSFPMMCKMTLYPWGDKSRLTRLAGDVANSYNGNMYTFKHCVIESVNVNYAPSNPAFFSDEGNAPAFIILELSFLEIEYYTGDDFGRVGDQVDIGEAFGNIVDDVLGGKDPSEMTAEEQQNALGSAFNNRARIDTPANTTPAQSANTNNFNANSTVVAQYDDPESDDPSKAGKLYQTGDGSWYKVTTGPGGEKVTAIDSLTDPVFGYYGVYSPSTVVADATPIQFGNGKDILIRTDAGGQLQLGSA